MQNKILLWTSLLVVIAAIISYFYFDLPVAIFFYSLKNGFINKGFKIITKLGTGGWILIPSFLIFISFRRNKKTLAQRALYLLSVVAISGIIVDIIKVIAGRFRPKVYFREGLYGFDFFHIDYQYLSFPSGHSSTALSAMVAFGIFWPKFRIYFLFAGIVIALSRVIINSHYLSDVLIGSLIGVLTSILLHHLYFKEKIDRAKQSIDSAE